MVLVDLVDVREVGDWRQGREQAQTETIHLHRLSHELKSCIASPELVTSAFEEHRRAVGYLSDSLAAGQEETRVRCDFDRLRAQKEIRNGYHCAEDRHGDRVEWSNRLLEPAGSADAALTTELDRRWNLPCRDSRAITSA